MLEVQHKIREGYWSTWPQLLISIALAWIRESAMTPSLPLVYSIDSKRSELWTKTGETTQLRDHSVIKAAVIKITKWTFNQFILLAPPFLR